MKKKIFYFIVFSLCFTSLFGNDDEYYTKLQRDFVIGDINAKEQIIQNIPKKDKKNYAPIYIKAINFIGNHHSILYNNEQFLNIGIIAIRGIGQLNEKKAIQDIRYLFASIDDEEFKIACINTLAKLIEKDSAFTSYLNTKYEEGLSDLINGKKLNVNLLIAYSEALGEFADPSSFDILFKTLLYPVDESLKKAVKEALNNIFFDYSTEILSRIGQKDLQYIHTLYELAKENKQINNQKLGEISEAVLKFAIDGLDPTSKEVQELILKTLPVFSQLKWSNASKNINSFFYIAQTAWKQSKFSTEDLIKLVNCMGEIGTLESSKNLSIFLGVLHSQTEKTMQYDEALLLSVIEALGKLGSKTAFDYLLFIEYLDYSNTVKIAAKQAIEELKW